MIWTIITIGLALLTIFLGTQAIAWRRACIYIASKARPVYQLEKYGVESVKDLKSLPEAKNQDYGLFTPKWVVFRFQTAMFLLLITTISAFFILKWYLALLGAIVIYGLMELLAFLLPKKDNSYYLNQVWDTFEGFKKIAERSNNSNRAEEMEKRIKALESAFKDKIIE